MLTAQALYDMYEHGGQCSNAIIYDLFGINNWPKEIHANQARFNQRLLMFDGLYKGLYLMKVPAKAIEAHRRANKLDVLIHEMYKGRESDYYKQFCKEGIAIGPTHYSR